MSGVLIEGGFVVGALALCGSSSPVAPCGIFVAVGLICGFFVSEKLEREVEYGLKM